MRLGSRTKVSVPLVLPQNRHPERSASQTYHLKEDLRRGVEEPVPSGVEGTPRMLVDRCSSERSGHQNLKEIKKVTTSDHSEARRSDLQFPLMGKRNPEWLCAYAIAERLADA